MEPIARRASSAVLQAWANVLRVPACVKSDPTYRRDRLETSIATAISAIPARMVASAD
jgi:hypothetical protein